MEPERTTTEPSGRPNFPRASSAQARGVSRGAASALGGEPGAAGTFGWTSPSKPATSGTLVPPVFLKASEQVLLSCSKAGAPPRVEGVLAFCQMVWAAR